MPPRRTKKSKKGVVEKVPSATVHVSHENSEDNRFSEPQASITTVSTPNNPISARLQWPQVPQTTHFIDGTETIIGGCLWIAICLYNQYLEKEFLCGVISHPYCAYTLIAVLAKTGVVYAYSLLCESSRLSALSHLEKTKDELLISWGKYYTLNEHALQISQSSYTIMSCKKELSFVFGSREAKKDNCQDKKSCAILLAELDSLVNNQQLSHDDKLNKWSKTRQDDLESCRVSVLYRFCLPCVDMCRYI
jgi:hypothetical protein